MEVKLQVEDLSLPEVIKLVRQHKPDLVAFDNLYEAAESPSDVPKIAQKFPPRTKLVQVTGSPSGGYQKLTYLARSHGLWAPHQGKPNASQSAELVARLALAGVGYRVLSFEDELKVTVGKNRKVGKGGWSAPRFQRNIEISVSNVAKAFMERLDERGVDYDQFSYPKRAVLIVHPSPEKQVTFQSLVGMAKEFSNDLAFARISQVPKSSLEFVPLTGKAPSHVPTKKTQTVIVGVDPGTTTGLAILSANNGGLLSLVSAREFGTSQIVRHISQHGRAIMVCADVNFPPPHSVQKLNRMLGTQLYAPPRRATPRGEKRGIVQDYLDRHDHGGAKTDNHQRDALFAAIKGYNSVRTKIDRIHGTLEDRPDLARYQGRIIDQVISGVSVHDAVTTVEAQITAEQLRARLVAAEAEGKGPTQLDVDRFLERQNDRFEDLLESLRLVERDKVTLKEENTRLSDQIADLQRKLHKVQRESSYEVRRDQAVEEQVIKVAQLTKDLRRTEEELADARERVDQLKRIRLIWVRGERIPLKPVNQLHMTELGNTEKELGVRAGDIILLLDPSGGSSNAAKWLVEREVRAIVVPKSYLKRLSHLARRVLEEAEVPLLEEDVITYRPDQSREHRKDKVVLFEGIHIINKRYLLQRLYEAEVAYVKAREELQVRTHREQREPEIPADKHSVEFLLSSYQNHRSRLSRRRLEVMEAEFKDYEEDEM